MNVNDGRGGVTWLSGYFGAELFFFPGPEPTKPQKVSINQRLHIGSFTSSRGVSVFFTSEFSDTAGLPDGFGRPWPVHVCVCDKAGACSTWLT